MIPDEPYSAASFWRGFWSTAWAWAKSIFWVLAILGFLCALLVGASMPGLNRQRSCEAADGHYVPAPVFGNDECWSADGSHRLFPRGW